MANLKSAVSPTGHESKTSDWAQKFSIVNLETFIEVKIISIKASARDSEVHAASVMFLN